MKTRVAALLAAISIVIGLAGCTVTGRRTGAQKFLNKDIVAIADCAREILETGEVPKDVHFDGVEKIYTMPDTGWVAFVTGSRDLRGEFVQVGFYYSPDDEPMGFLGQDMELTQDPVKTDTYTGGENMDDGMESSYLTEHMQVGWYYYEWSQKPIK